MASVFSVRLRTFYGAIRGGQLILALICFTFGVAHMATIWSERFNNFGSVAEHQADKIWILIPPVLTFFTALLQIFVSRCYSWAYDSFIDLLFLFVYLPVTAGFIHSLGCWDEEICRDAYGEVSWPLGIIALILMCMLLVLHAVAFVAMCCSKKINKDLVGKPERYPYGSICCASRVYADDSSVQSEKKAAKAEKKKRDAELAKAEAAERN